VPLSRPEVFLSHATSDAQAVQAIAGQLKNRGVPVWLDEWNLVPGDPWVDALGQALRECCGCVVFFGPGGGGPWHNEEVRRALDRAARDAEYRLIPVLLPGATRERLSGLPDFLASRTWVDFGNDPDPIRRAPPVPPRGVHVPVSALTTEVSARWTASQCEGRW
jgi:hypothetical protein